MALRPHNAAPSDLTDEWARHAAARRATISPIGAQRDLDSSTRSCVQSIQVPGRQTEFENCVRTTVAGAGAGARHQVPSGTRARLRVHFTDSASRSRSHTSIGAGGCGTNLHRRVVPYGQTATYKGPRGARPDTPDKPSEHLYRTNWKRRASSARGVNPHSSSSVHQARPEWHRLLIS